MLRKLREKNLELQQSSDFKYIQGIGVSGVVNGKKIVAVGPNYFTQEKNQFQNYQQRLIKIQKRLLMF